ncbi:MAG: hypothetical protein DHS20C17_31140 [Cyclobacteriaceae bacterium]|nr:MAG: hypothetical protein DHS20C17_31140 [Cyclobacteriaceae bacterium]
MNDSDTHGDSILRRYTYLFKDVDGWFTYESQVVWDFLMSFQSASGINGNFMEIGVWKGKSAILGAMHLQNTESAVLVDALPDMSEATKGISLISNCNVETIACRSSMFRLSGLYDKYVGSIKWFHVDGEHTGYTALNDLAIAADMLGEKGIICVDDFMSPRYPQLAAAVFRFLFDNPIFKMFLNGENKCYICRTEDYVMYENVVRHNLSEYLKLHGISDRTVSKTSHAHDMGCFSIEPRFHDRDMVGMDHDLDTIVF